MVQYFQERRQLYHHFLLVQQRYRRTRECVAVSMYHFLEQKRSFRF
jgi:hypothetical protein